MKSVILITGASSGFGALTARALADAGHTVYASMRETLGRNAAQVLEAQRYADEHRVDLRSVELDVASTESVQAGVAKIIGDCGQLDVIIHNAGHMSFGPAEAFTPEQFAQLYDINVLSTQRVNRAALPQLRKQGRGLVLWVSSSSARGGTPPYLAPYFAAKAAMDSLAVSYASELTRWGWRRQSSCRVRSPRAPTTSPIPVPLQTRFEPPNTTKALTPVCRIRHSKVWQPWNRLTRMSVKWPKPSSKSSECHWVPVHFGVISIHPRTVPRSSMPWPTGYALKCFAA